MKAENRRHNYKYNVKTDFSRIFLQYISLTSTVLKLKMKVMKIRIKKLKNNEMNKRKFQGNVLRRTVIRSQIKIK